MCGYARRDFMVPYYAQIAMLHYWAAKEDYLSLEKKQHEDETSLILRGSIQKNVMVTIMFSAIALEAFFNDFAAAKLGDNFFHENFELLRPIGKLQLISKFILHQDIDKGARLYELVNSLFKHRNQLVHSKSKDAHGMGMTESELEEWDKFLKTEAGQEFLKEERKIDVSEEREWAKDAYEALLALKEVGQFFDEYGEDKFALGVLLLSNAMISETEENINHIQTVQSELGVPLLVYPKDNT